MLCRIASWGYVVAASQYRGAMGSEGADQFGGDDIHDVMNLIPLLEAERGADASRIGMYGGSRGGMMTYLALTKTARIRAAVVRCGMSDLTGWAEERRDMESVYAELIPGFRSADDSPLITRSAVYWPEKLCKSTPILLLQGTADWRVNPVSALRFAEALFAVKHPFRLVMLEGSDHALTEHISERERQTREWLDRYVRDRAPLPRLEPHGE
jgi:dipeptidyl aminopeptidase/acylaminoacyl peptidase